MKGLRALLLDLDGVLYVEDEPLPGARKAVTELRERGLALRFVTNTTSQPRRLILERLRRLGFDVEAEELSTPAALAVARCVERGRRRAMLLVRDDVKEDFAELEDVEQAEAVIVGDLGEAFDYGVLNRAFRRVIDGAELIALQKNRYWLRRDEHGGARRRQAVEGLLRDDPLRHPGRGRRLGDGRRRRRVRRRRRARRGARRDPRAHRQVPRGRGAGLRRRADRNRGLDRRRAGAAGRARLSLTRAPRGRSRGRRWRRRA